MKDDSVMITFINFTGIHAPGTPDTLAHIDNRPFAAIYTFYHSNSVGWADTDATAAAFTFFPVKIIWHNGPDIINCFIHISSASSGAFLYGISIDGNAILFCCKNNKHKKTPHYHMAMWQQYHPIFDQTIRQYNPASYYNI